MNIDDNGNKNGDQKLIFKSEFSNIVSMWQILSVCAQSSLTLWTEAHQIPLSMGFFRQEYWSEFPFLPPGDLPNPGTEPSSPAPPTSGGRVFTTEPPGKPSHTVRIESMC